MSETEITFNNNKCGSHMYCVSPCPDAIETSLDGKVQANLTTMHKWSDYK